MNEARISISTVRVIAIATALLINAPAWGQSGTDRWQSEIAGRESFAPSRPVSADELASLVAPIALYPDDLVAIVLPASTLPVQVVQAANFLERVQHDPGLQPGSQLDESIVALLNYPTIVAQMNSDLDWTRRLGEAVLAQEPDVILAIERFRERAWSAGNLRSDERQLISREQGALTITPVDPQVIYVPYYEPRRVIVWSSVPVYYYHPRPYASYYYAYPAGHVFPFGFFWGISSVFSIAWHSHHVRVLPFGHRRHNYYRFRDYRRDVHRRPIARHSYRRPTVAARDRRAVAPRSVRRSDRRTVAPRSVQRRDRGTGSPRAVQRDNRRAVVTSSLPGNNRRSAATRTVQRDKRRAAAASALPGDNRRTAATRTVQRDNRRAAVESSLRRDNRRAAATRVVQRDKRSAAATRSVQRDKRPAAATRSVQSDKRLTVEPRSDPRSTPVGGRRGKQSNKQGIRRPVASANQRVAARKKRQKRE